MTSRKYTYGRSFKMAVTSNRKSKTVEVMYRYTGGKKSTKTLVYVSTLKPVYWSGVLSMFDNELCAVCHNVLKEFKTLESVAPWLCKCPKESEIVNVQGTFMGYGIYWRSAWFVTHLGSLIYKPSSPVDGWRRVESGNMLPEGGRLNEQRAWRMILIMGRSLYTFSFSLSICQGPKNCIL